MSQLADFQNVMSASLRDSSVKCPAAVVQQNASGVSRRFDVYRNNRMVSLLDNLQAAYPTVCQLVGEDYFRSVARLYIEEHPPASPVMAEYGASFGPFLAGMPNLERIPYIADIAKLDWACLRSYHAEDAIPIDADVLVSVAPEEFETLCFSAHPSAAIVTSRWPVGSIYQSIAQATEQHNVDMSIAQDVLIVRPVIDVDVQILPAEGAALFKRLCGGEPLLAAVDFVSQRFPDFDPGSHLQGLLGFGVFTSVYNKGK